jgi:hypothetical protein
VLSRYISCWPLILALEIILAVLVLASVLVVVEALTVVSVIVMSSKFQWRVVGNYVGVGNCGCFSGLAYRDSGDPMTPKSREKPGKIMKILVKLSVKGFSWNLKLFNSSRNKNLAFPTEKCIILVPKEPRPDPV